MLVKAVGTVLSLGVAAWAQTYSATYSPSNAPDHSEQGQSGTNKCSTGSNQTSQCQNAYLNSVDDFCVFAPPEAGPASTIGETEAGYGTRVIPDGTIQGAHFVQTPDYVQITGGSLSLGVGDLTKINVPGGDAGGELDPHGADGNGNPIGGLVFSSAFTGQPVQLHEWTNFVSDTEFCFRGCKDGPNAPALCQHIYDVMGCEWNMPGNYGNGSFDRCKADSGEPMGVYGGSTFHQGDPATPAAHPAPASSSCTNLTSIGNAVSGAPTSTSSSAVGAPIPSSAFSIPSASSNVTSAISTPLASASSNSLTSSQSSTGSAAVTGSQSQSQVTRSSGSSGSAAPTGGSASSAAVTIAPGTAMLASLFATVIAGLVL
ncbi:hypothetical protein EVG20_g3093 [Dentipellis fragilis]|uniref:Carbohydrate-binding module family 13 protein n=1 Tax=Dentipellis fragilis TaxID=205917 RepID=A0A4Y9Z6V6_9AGAM|nr:hypothetical protein EVG20_g3093 [Dentipellis fragilis]